MAVRYNQMIIWMTDVSGADLTVLGMEKSELPFLLLPRLGWLFSNETGRQESVTLMGVPDT